MYLKIRSALLAVFLLGFMIQSAAALNAKLEVVAEGLTAPLVLKSPPDGTKRRFIVEQIGLIKILMPDGKILPEPFLNIQGKIVTLMHIFDERGLLGLAFHPNFKNNGKFYVSYTAPIRGDAPLEVKFWYNHTKHYSEFQVSKDDPNKANPLSERILLQLDWPQFNHNGGDLHFGPDGYLYISVGDGGYANDWGIGHNVTEGNGQDLNVLHGKILRIDVDKGDPYGIPRDNPFVNRDDAREEIYAYGFRNPWRMSFDMGGDRALFVGDVQQNSYEEVDIVIKGGNYGWRRMEGTHCFDYVNPNDHPASCDKSGLISPIFDYNNCNVHESCRGLSVTGGFVYRGKHGAWQGKYFFGDWSKQFGVKDGRLYAATKRGSKWNMEEIRITNMTKFNSYVLAFGQDADGEVYVLSTNTTGPVGGLDKIYKIVP